MELSHQQLCAIADIRCGRKKVKMRWDDLVAINPLTRRDLLYCTVLSTEDFENGPGVEAFASYLDQRWKGFFSVYIDDCFDRANIELGLEGNMPDEIFELIVSPDDFFQTEHNEVLYNRFDQWWSESVCAKWPEHLKYLVYGNMLKSVFEPFAAFEYLQLAMAIKREPRLAQLIMRNDQYAISVLLEIQIWMIDILLDHWPKK